MVVCSVREGKIGCVSRCWEMVLKGGVVCCNVVLKCVVKLKGDVEVRMIVVV